MGQRSNPNTRDACYLLWPIAPHGTPPSHRFLPTSPTSSQWSMNEWRSGRSRGEFIARFGSGEAKSATANYTSRESGFSSNIEKSEKKWKKKVKKETERHRDLKHRVSSGNCSSFWQQIKTENIIIPRESHSSGLLSRKHRGFIQKNLIIQIGQNNFSRPDVTSCLPGHPEQSYLWR